MEDRFLTIDQVAEILKDKGYDRDIVQKYVAAGKVPYSVMNYEILIPWPETEPCFPELFTDEQMRAMGAVFFNADDGSQVVEVESKTPENGGSRIPN